MSSIQKKPSLASHGNNNNNSNNNNNHNNHNNHQTRVNSPSKSVAGSPSTVRNSRVVGHQPISNHSSSLSQPARFSRLQSISNTSSNKDLASSSSNSNSLGSSTESQQQQKEKTEVMEVYLRIRPNITEQHQQSQDDQGTCLHVSSPTTLEVSPPLDVQFFLNLFQNCCSCFF